MVVEKNPFDIKHLPSQLGSDRANGPVGALSPTVITGNLSWKISAHTKELLKPVKVLHLLTHQHSPQLELLLEYAFPS